MQHIRARFKEDQFILVALHNGQVGDVIHSRATLIHFYRFTSGLKDRSKPYSPTPGARSTKLDEITSVVWNQQVLYLLAPATTGHTVVWDLRGKREVVALAYGGGAGTLTGQVESGWLLEGDVG